MAAISGQARAAVVDQRKHRALGIRRQLADARKRGARQRCELRQGLEVEHLLGRLQRNCHVRDALRQPLRRHFALFLPDVDPYRTTPGDTRDDQIRSATTEWRQHEAARWTGIFDQRPDNRLRLLRLVLGLAVH
jgi:hypothetical protein